MLEAEVPLVAKVMWGLRFADDDDVLDADAVPPVGVVSRFYKRFVRQERRRNSGWETYR